MLLDGRARELDRRLSRLEAAATEGPWTMSVLAVIWAEPGRRAGDLAAADGCRTRPTCGSSRRSD